MKVWNPQLVIPRKVMTICTILMFRRTNQFGPVFVELFNGLLHLISVTMTMIQPHKMSDFLSSFFNLAWEKNRHFATLPLISTRNDVLTTSPVIPYWWCIRITTQDLGSYTSLVWNFCARFSEKKQNKKTTKQTKKQENKEKNTELKKQKQTNKKNIGKEVVASRRFPLRLISTEHFMFYRMHLLTVAGEATARSWTSNNMCMVLLSLIRSLLARQSILLSSKTVFMFSIHRASTGPSHTIHLWSSVVSWGETVKNGHYGV